MIDLRKCKKGDKLLSFIERQAKMTDVPLLDEMDKCLAEIGKIDERASERRGRDDR